MNTQNQVPIQNFHSQNRWVRLWGRMKILFWRGVAWCVLAGKRFWRIKFNFWGKQIRLAWLVLGILILIVIIVIGENSLNKNSVQSETFKNKKYDYKVEVPAGMQTQLDDKGVLTLTDATKGGRGTGCLVNIPEPMEIGKDKELKQFAIEYRDSQDEKYDFELVELGEDEAGKYDEGIKMILKNPKHREEAWYFMRDGKRVIMYEVWKHRQTDRDCGEWMKVVLD